MANQSLDDVYDDPDNVLTESDSLKPMDNGLEADQLAEVSQTPYLPEREIYKDDSRGPLIDVDPDANPETNNGNMDSSDLDANRLSSTNESPDGMTVSE